MRDGNHHFDRPLLFPAPGGGSGCLFRQLSYGPVLALIRAKNGKISGVLGMYGTGFTDRLMWFGFFIGGWVWPAV